MGSPGNAASAFAHRPSAHHVQRHRHALPLRFDGVQAPQVHLHHQVREHLDACQQLPLIHHCLGNDRHPLTEPSLGLDPGKWHMRWVVTAADTAHKRGATAGVYGEAHVPLQSPARRRHWCSGDSPECPLRRPCRAQAPPATACGRGPGRGCSALRSPISTYHSRGSSAAQRSVHARTGLLRGNVLQRVDPVVSLKCHPSVHPTPKTVVPTLVHEPTITPHRDISPACLMKACPSEQNPLRGKAAVRRPPSPVGRTLAPSRSRSPPASGRMYSPLSARSTPVISSVLSRSSPAMRSPSSSRSLSPPLVLASSGPCVEACAGAQEHVLERRQGKSGPVPNETPCAIALSACRTSLLKPLHKNAVFRVSLSGLPSETTCRMNSGSRVRPHVPAYTE